MVEDLEKYCDAVWKDEGIGTWRIYPKTFDKIIGIVGHNKKVLDVGCGVGILLNRLKKHGNTVVGVDVSNEALQCMRKHFHITGLQMRVPPVDKKKLDLLVPFDFVVATEMFEHVEDDKALFEDCMGLLKPGGELIVAVPNNVLGPDEEPQHERKYSFKSLKKLLGDDAVVERFTEDFQPSGWKSKDDVQMRIRLPVLFGRVKKK